jgi:hypothetical protein
VMRRQVEQDAAAGSSRFFPLRHRMG